MIWQHHYKEIKTINKDLHVKSRFVTYPQRGALSVVAGEVQDAFCGHGQTRVLRETRHPVLMFVQILLKKTT